MAPKFKGDSEDWMDDSRANASGKRPATRQKQGVVARSTALPLEESNAVVVEVFSNQCRVKFDSDHTEILCSYRRAGVISGKKQTETRERTPVAVGDRVAALGLNPQSGVIEGVCQRRNALYRLAPGRVGESTFHVLAANVDLLVIVASADRPAFVPGLVDRFLVAAEWESIPVALCVTKMDLPLSEKAWNPYSQLGYPVFEVSVRSKLGIDLLRQEIHQKSVVFCGQSGVGKTSLLRVLVGKEVGRVGEVNEVTGKGRHTTTGAVLLEGPEDSRWIDTPGVKEFGLANITPANLKNLFPEFKGLDCSVTGCLHREEEGCLARSFYRYPSYSKIFNSLSEDARS